MKHVKISTNAVLAEGVAADDLVKRITDLMPGGEITVSNVSEFEQRSTQGLTKELWLRDFDLDEPWVITSKPYDMDDGDDLNEEAHDFLRKVAVMQCMYGTYPDAEKYGMPVWADSYGDSTEAKAVASEYDFPVAEEDFDFEGSCTHDDSSSVIWIKLLLSEEDFEKFEKLQSTGHLPVGSVGQDFQQMEALSASIGTSN